MSGQVPRGRGQDLGFTLRRWEPLENVEQQSGHGPTHIFTCPPLADFGRTDQRGKGGYREPWGAVMLV